MSAGSARMACPAQTEVAPVGMCPMRCLAHADELPPDR